MSETDHITDDLPNISALDADEQYEDGIDDWRYWYTPEQMRRNCERAKVLDRERAATSPVYRLKTRIYALDLRVPEQAAERARLEEEMYGYWRAGEWTRIDTHDMAYGVGHVAGSEEIDRILADNFAQRCGFARIEDLLPLLQANEERWGLPITESWL